MVKSGADFLLQQGIQVGAWLLIFADCEKIIRRRQSQTDYSYLLKDTRPHQGAFLILVIPKMNVFPVLRLIPRHLLCQWVPAALESILSFCEGSCR